MRTRRTVKQRELQAKTDARSLAISLARLRQENPALYSLLIARSDVRS